MPVKQSGTLNFACDFAGHDEEVSLEYRHFAEDWYCGVLTASQCGMRISAPFIFMGEYFEEFLLELQGFDEQLHMPQKAATFYDFTTQNGIVVGPLVPYHGIMFLDIFVRYDAVPHNEHLGTWDSDSYEGKYRAARSSIEGYPNHQLADSGYGICVEIRGLQFGRGQIRHLVRSHLEQ